ncbi:MAG TPA: dienelactone hydrolase family protein [Acidimicrobiales bacterium]|nr:dienelactone hydrolase family protein [Acidimicrobiales bacterium]
MSDDKTTAYVALPDTKGGPGVLVLHSWWGLNAGTRSICDRLASMGFVALAPDLFGGSTPSDQTEAETLLAEIDPNLLVRDVRAAAEVLLRLPATEGDHIGVVGMSMGGSMALWLSDRAPELVRATVTFYGLQDLAFDQTTSAYLCHFAESDPFVDDDAATYLEAVLHLGDLDTEISVHRYPGTGHWFFEPGQSGFDAEAAEQAWARTAEFLARNLGPGA